MRRAIIPLGMVLLLAGTSSSYALSDQAFLDAAVHSDNSEVLLGDLAAKSGGSDAVKRYGQMIEGDHDKARIDVVRMLDAMGVATPTAATSEAGQEWEKLKGMSGAEFDREFVIVMIRMHEKDISDFTTEADSGDGPVARLARMSLPMLEQHLQMAKTIAKSET